MTIDGYTIQRGDFGYYVRDWYGDVVVETATEEEAIEYVKDIKKEISRSVTTDLYKQFDLYTKYMPRKCYLEKRIATTSYTAFMNIVQSFEKKKKCSIDYSSEIRDGETFYIVNKIIDNQ